MSASDFKPQESKVEEGSGPSFFHDLNCPCPDCELSRIENTLCTAKEEAILLEKDYQALRLENESLKWELDAVKKERAKWEAKFYALPKTERDCNLYELHPKCKACTRGIEYYVAFRGNIVGKLFAGIDSNKVTEQVMTQGELQAEAKGWVPPEIPEGFGEEKDGEKKE